MKAVTDENFDSTVSMHEGKLVIVDCHAEWCAPCKILKPTLEKVASEMQEAVEIYGADIEESPGLAKKFQIRGVPTLLWFKDGSLVKTTVGVMKKEQLVSEIRLLTS